MRSFFRVTAAGLVALLGLAAAALVAALWLPMPRKDGVQFVAGLEAPVEIDFDSLGIPHIHARNRQDAFAALGYATARDRLFQMDILRRRSAGRLAEIFGSGLLNLDKWNRVMGFPQIARAVLERLPANQRAALDGYSAGVNRAIEEAWVLPVEFTMLGYRPAPWRPEDSISVILGLSAVSFGGNQERMASVMRRALPLPVVEFLTPESDCYNERLAPREPERCASQSAPFDDLEALMRDARKERAAGLTGRFGSAQGSNGWVVAPAKTKEHKPLLANDMHLELALPNIWYRAQLDYGDVRLVGLVVPGAPMLISGSNGKVAWGLTSVEGDFTDLVRIEHDGADPMTYRSADGPRRFGTRTESVAVRGAATETFEVKETIWGPVASESLLGDEVAVRWTALDPAATNFDLMNMDDIATVGSAISLLKEAGGPPLNVLLADRSGAIGWTLMGRLPKRFGMDGLFSESWADGARGWRGYYRSDELPSIVDPLSGFLVNTNQRMLGADQFAPKIGHDFSGGYRAWRVTERLRELSGASEGDMLALQLDSVSEPYRYYQKLALDALDGAVDLGGDAAALRPYLAAWDGRAEADSLGLPLLVEFRQALIDAIFSPLVAKCRKLDPAFIYEWSGMDGPLQTIIASGRGGLLPEAYSDWPTFLRAVLTRTARELMRRHDVASVADLTWGRVNRVQIGHFLTNGVPVISQFLDMPRRPLAGCRLCVRFSLNFPFGSSSGANARMVVAPGRESDGLMEMPGGQSGQPGAEHYGDQQEDWLLGRPSPLLAGEPRHKIILKPASLGAEAHADP
ncbi:penicillin acylase family protein [Methylosinus sp. Sm6]|uniref:penicillin acylase family protein n=1 Tax=Methylosinus sp. Sm6 TaxID=2866948 RepID=UPI001C9961D0|nr:penicillin acylase family protein [Methylosinus sp. Sm6]MBY6243602.1 penicillin acylase family protein [Methylosinus sp. Sm6]